MAKRRSRRYLEAAKLVDRTRKYSVEEAFEIIGKMPKTKFQQTVELHCVLGVDPRKADQQVRGTVMLPHGTGKTKRVLAFVTPDKEKEAREAGADYIGTEETVKEITKGWLDFEAVIATPDMMKLVGRLGKILGPRGMMPSPKNGTLTPNVSQAIEEIKSGRVEYRLDKNAIIHTIIGRENFEAEKLAENFKTMYNAIVKAKPSVSKGQYIKTVSLTTTMNPGIDLDLAACRRFTEGV